MSANQTTGTFGNSTIYRAEWRDGQDIARWLSRMTHGQTLNFPCGTMQWGDVRADINPDLDPDIVADIRDPPFERRSFDCTYVDPPYSLCAYDTVYDWILDIWDCTDQRMICNMPNVRVHIAEADYRLFVEHRPPSPAMCLFHVYDRPDTQLSDFGGEAA